METCNKCGEHYDDYSSVIHECPKAYTQDELDERIASACERQKKIIGKRIADLDISLPLMQISALEDAVYDAPLPTEDK